jgi:O-antigen/teichoic acid export membrane protein
MVAIGLIMALFSRPLLALFGPEFVRGQWALIILLVGFIFSGQSALLTTHIMGRGKSQIAATATAVSLVLAVVLNLVLIPSLGIAGAALATTLSRFAMTLIATIYFARVIDGDVLSLFRVQRTDLRIFAEIVGLARDLWRKLLRRG